MAFATWNPADKDADLTLSNGDRTVSFAGTGSVRATQSKSAGKYYFEVSMSGSNVGENVGVANAGYSLASKPGLSNESHAIQLGNGICRSAPGETDPNYATAFVNTDVCMVAIDIDAGKIWFGRNGTWFASGDPAAGTGAAYSSLAGTTWYPVVGGNNGGFTLTANFDSADFAYSAPSGFSAWDFLDTERNVDGDVAMNMRLTGFSTTGPRHADGDVELSIDLDGVSRRTTKYITESDIQLSMTVDGTMRNSRRTAIGDVELSMTVDGESVVVVSYTAAITLPELTSAGEILNTPAFSLASTLPALTSAGELISGGYGVLNRSLPRLTVQAVANPGAAFTLGKLALVAVGVQGNVATSARTLPALTIAGTFDNAAFATLQRSLPRVISSGLSVTGGLGSAGLTLVKPYSSITAAAGGLGTLASSLRAVTLSTEAFTAGILSGDIVLPGIQATISLDNGATLATTVWSLNTETFDVTNYNNYAFIGFCYINGTYYGIKSDGIYSLGGDTDDGIDIDASFVTGDADFRLEQKKRMDKAYVGYESDGDMLLSANGRDYPLQREIATVGIKNSRVSLAKGIKSRYWNLGMENVDGSDFHINELGILPRILERKT